jgi:predicted transcriptional regulator
MASLDDLRKSIFGDVLISYDEFNKQKSLKESLDNEIKVINDEIEDMEKREGNLKYVSTINAETYKEVLKEIGVVNKVIIAIKNKKLLELKQRRAELDILDNYQDDKIIDIDNMERRI